MRTLSLLSQQRTAEVRDLWWTYLASYDGGAGSTVVNLALRDKAPIVGHKHLIVTGVSYVDSGKGLPSGQELDNLNSISDKRLRLIRGHTSKPILVGSFTQNNERLDYIYVTDTTGLKEALEKFYREASPERKPYINIKEDPKWEAYLDFLYPNKDTIDSNRNELTEFGFFEKN